MTKRRPYVRPMGGWWRRNPFYVFYMLREATSVFLAIYALQLLYGLYALHGGEPPFTAWLTSLRHPLYVVFHVLALAAALLHAFTWFNVSPKAMPPVYLAGHRVADRTVVWGQFAVFAVVSVGLLALVIGS